MSSSKSTTSNVNEIEVLGDKISEFGLNAVRITVAIVLSWIGAMKFTAYEAGAIEGLVASSPFTSWLYNVTTIQGASSFIGSVEIITAVLIIIGAKLPKAGLVGSLAAFTTFLVTASFLFTAPGWEASLGGFPALSVVPGQFLLKDIVLLAAATVLIGDALKRIAKNV